MSQDAESRMLKLRKGGVEYIVFRPSHPMDVFVDYFMIAKGYPTYLETRLFPNNEIELFFNLGDLNQGQLLADKPNLAFTTSVISGLRSSFMRVFPGGLFYVVGMRFTLFGFYHLFHLPATEIQDRNYQANEVLGKEINQLRQRLAEQTDPLKQISIMYNWTRLQADKDFHAALAWRKVEQSLRKPDFIIKQSIPSLLGYSYKHSIHLITKMCGLPPKMVQRIYRMRNLFNYQNLLDDYSWAQIANEMGYSDQSHLIREFKLFTGFTPSQLVKILPKDVALNRLR